MGDITIRRIFLPRVNHYTIGGNPRGIRVNVGIIIISYRKGTEGHLANLNAQKYTLLKNSPEKKTTKGRFFGIPITHQNLH